MKNKEFKNFEYTECVRKKRSRDGNVVEVKKTVKKFGNSVENRENFFEDVLRSVGNFNSKWLLFGYVFKLVWCLNLWRAIPFIPHFERTLK